MSFPGFPKDLAEIVAAYAPRLKLREWIEEAKIRECETIWSNPAAIEANFLNLAEMRKHSIGAAANPALVEFMGDDAEYYLCRVTAWSNPLFYERLIAQGGPVGIEWVYLSSNTHPSAAELIICNQNRPIDICRARANPSIAALMRGEFPSDGSNIGNSHPDIQEALKLIVSQWPPLIEEHSPLIVAYYRNLLSNPYEWAMDYILKMMPYLNETEMSTLAQNPGIFVPYRSAEYVMTLTERV